MSPFNRAHMISYNSSLIETMCLFCTIFEMRRVICRPTSPAFGAPFGDNLIRVSKTVWYQKTGVPWLSSSIVCVVLCLVVFVEFRLVADTHRHRAIGYTVQSIARAMKMSLFVVLSSWHCDSSHSSVPGSHLPLNQANQLVCETTSRLLWSTHTIAIYYYCSP